MKYLKYPLLLILALIVIFVLLCFVGPKNLNVLKSTQVSAPSSIIFNLTNDLKARELWNEWTLTDSTISIKYNNIQEGVGAESSWTSQITGAGTEKIIESIPHEHIRSTLTFEGWDGQNYADIDLSQEGDKTSVSWSFEGSPLPFLMRGVAVLSGMKNHVEVNYEKGLKNLKNIAEQRAQGVYAGYDIKVEELEEKHFIMNRQEVDLSNIQQFYATNLGALFTKVQNANLEMTGMPCGLFFKMPNKGNLVDMAAAMPVALPVEIEGSASFSIPAQDAVTLDFYGPYDTFHLGHDAIEQYMKDRNYLSDPPIIEEYVTDPATEKDPNKWLTKITYYFSIPQ